LIVTTSNRKLLQALSFCGLALSVIPAFLVLGGAMARQTYLYLMLLGMFLWFGSAIFWIKKDDVN